MRNTTNVLARSYKMRSEKLFTLQKPLNSTLPIKQRSNMPVLLEIILGVLAAIALLIFIVRR